jgi:hypothetical protein
LWKIYGRKIYWWKVSARRVSWWRMCGW